MSVSRASLQSIEVGVLTLEENPTNADTLNSIFREFHTFKGGSGFLNLLPMKNLAHELESLLDLAHNHKLTVTSTSSTSYSTVVTCSTKHISEMTLQLSGEKTVGGIVVPAQALIA